MNKLFTDNAWSDYIYWETEDRKTLRRINKLIEDISRNGNEGIGKPEPLIGEFTGFWSRRINDKDRLIYRIEGSDICILACRYQAGKVFEEVRHSGAKVVIKNNVPECVLLSPDEYVRLIDEVNDARLLAIAVDRMNSIDPSSLITQDEVDRRFDFTVDALESIPEVEFE